MNIDNEGPSNARPRVVIVGGGFGGMAAAKALKHADCAVTLIDRTNHHLFQPLLYQVATAALSPSDIATAARVLLRQHANVTVRMAEVVGVDTAARTVRLADGERLPYDYLVLATGAAYSFFGHDDWADHAQVLKSLDDALSIRARLLGAFELAEQSKNAAEIARLLTFVIVGGGPTGVEMAGTIAELARATLARDFKHIDPAAARVILCEAGPRILPAFTERLSSYGLAAVDSLGVEVRLGDAVTSVDRDGLLLGDERIASANVIWAAGTRARPAAQWLDAPAARNNGVVVQADCSVPGQSDVFAIGDVASYTREGQTLPGLAPVAKQQGRYVGRVIAARLAGNAAPPAFHYRDWGTMAVIGRSRAIAALGGVRMTGFPAWLLWSFVHLMLLVDFRSRVSVYTNWAWAWFTYGRGARLLTQQSLAEARAPIADRIVL